MLAIIEPIYPPKKLDQSEFDKLLGNLLPKIYQSKAIGNKISIIAVHIIDIIIDLFFISLFSSSKILLH